MKIHISFVFEKIRSAFNENTYQFFRVKKVRYAFNENTNKFFRVKKKTRSAFNENTDKFLRVKKIRSTFNENTYQFLRFKKKSDLKNLISVFSLEIQIKNFRLVFSLKRSLIISRF